MVKKSLNQGDVSNFCVWQKSLLEKIGRKEKQLTRLLLESAPEPLRKALQRNNVVSNLLHYGNAGQLYHSADSYVYLGHQEHIVELSLNKLKKQLAVLRRAWKGVVTISSKEDHAKKTLSVNFLAVDNRQREEK
ncbi:hypothetical protein A2482_04050 [Candidatus Falkowbacteria bacterium RIFOXYC2_FULL_48_21]|uniref:Uncharacterized protein n=1 Tax=Candidatus Falkowbacteria bacterium RIFOXYC2_FULL_48_21 TaxID=1798005 RepID=A0A1F5T8S4_9BACT|nr:MAG: hypothetical protein A2482_04050 [Candidatus Falkowbacteria bacterium RIFOXYC2_FULL_48_21]